MHVAVCSSSSFRNLKEEKGVKYISIYDFTLPERIVKLRSRKIGVSGLDGYLKLTWRSSISPFTPPSIFVPDSLLGSIFDGRSIIANMEAAADLALPESGPKELD